MADSEYTTVVIHGTWSKFSSRDNGWHTFEIDIPGRQYPVRADSKKTETIDAMMAVRDKEATFTLAERDGKNINEHTGKPYKDRYINEVVEGFVGEPTSRSSSAGGSTSEGKPAQQDDVDWDEKDRRDYWSRSWAHTMSAFEHRIPTDLSDEDLFKRLQAFQRKIYYDITGEWGMQRAQSYFPFETGNPRGAQAEPTSSPDPEEKPPPADDDIPF